MSVKSAQDFAVRCWNFVLRTGKLLPSDRCQKLPQWSTGLALERAAAAADNPHLHKAMHMANIGAILAGVGALLAVVGWIWTIVIAFQSGDTLWGILSICSLLAIVYAAMHMDKAKTQLFLMIGGILLQIVGGALGGTGAINAP
jgi:hypothetical protein